MYCIDRFFPPAEKGSNRQYIVLDRAGAMALGLNRFNKIKDLPYHYRHHKLVAEFHLKAVNLGLGWGELEYKKGGHKIDIWYPHKQIAVEIDTGCECYDTLRSHINKYNRMLGVKYLIFITDGGLKRVELFVEKVKREIKVTGGKVSSIDDNINEVIGDI